MENIKHDEMVIVMSKQLKKNLLFEGFAYTQVKDEENDVHFRCRVGICTSRIHLSGALAITKSTSHNHPPNFVKNKIDFVKCKI